MVSNIIFALNEISIKTCLRKYVLHPIILTLIYSDMFSTRYIGKYSSVIRNRKSQIIEALIPVIDKRMEGMATKDSSNISWTRPVCISFYV